MGINVGTQGEEGTLAWFPVMLGYSHLLPLAAFLYHVGTSACWLVAAGCLEKARLLPGDSCMFRTGSFSL